MLIAVVLGTIVSVIFGYLYANRKNLFSSFETRLGNESFGSFFNRLVNRKKAEMGGILRSQTAERKSKEARSKNKWESLLANVEAGSLKEKKIIALRKFIESLTSTNSSYIKNWAKQFKNYSSDGEVRLLKAARTLNLENAFIKDENKAEVFGINEIESMVKGYALLELYVEEAKSGKANALLDLCKRKNVHISYGIKAVEMMIMQKCGASTVGMLSSFSNKMFESSLRLKGLNYDKLNRSFLELIKLGGPEIIKKNLQSLITKIVLFESEARKKEQEKKSQSSKERKPKKKNPSVSGLSEYYEILGVPSHSSFDIVKKAFKKLAMQKHPDRLMSKNLSEIEMKRAHNEYLKIKSAFEKIESVSKKKAA
jgi:hypothetical protein